jgi:hypothetical protein
VSHGYKQARRGSKPENQNHGKAIKPCARAAFGLPQKSDFLKREELEP